MPSHLLFSQCSAGATHRTYTNVCYYRYVVATIPAANRTQKRIFSIPVNGEIKNIGEKEANQYYDNVLKPLLETNMTSGFDPVIILYSPNSGTSIKDIQTLFSAITKEREDKKPQKLGSLSQIPFSGPSLLHWGTWRSDFSLFSHISFIGHVVVDDQDLIEKLKDGKYTRLLVDYPKGSFGESQEVAGKKTQFNGTAKTDLETKLTA